MRWSERRTLTKGNIFDAAGKAIPFSGVYRDDFLTQRGVEFLRTRAKPPFLLVMSYLNTHHQNDSDQYIPPKELAGKYRDFFVPQDLRPLPGSWPSQFGDYYGCVANIDNAVATLTGALKQQGFLDNTIVLFTSDHGCHFKTRNTEYKRSPHDSSMHIPLIVAGPGFNRSLEVHELVSQVDLTPTLLEACGAPVPAVMQGRSLMPLVEGRREGWRDEVYIHMSEFMTGRILRTPRWTYAVAAPKKSGMARGGGCGSLRGVHAVRQCGGPVAAGESGGARGDGGCGEGAAGAVDGADCGGGREAAGDRAELLSV